MEEECLKLENQICFPLYVCSKEIIKRYKPFLDEIDLTYTQYIVMMALWQYKKLNVKELGTYLFLDSGTLTPLLKKLEQKGYVTRTKFKKDERNLIVAITPKGEKLKAKAKTIPYKMSECIKGLSYEDAMELQRLLRNVLNEFTKDV